MIIDKTINRTWVIYLIVYFISFINQSKSNKTAIKQPAQVDKYNTKALDKESLSNEKTEASFNSYEVKIVLN